MRIEDLGGEDGGGDRADAGDRVQVVGWQFAIGFDQQFFQGFLANLGVLDLTGGSPTRVSTADPVSDATEARAAARARG